MTLLLNRFPLEDNMFTANGTPNKELSPSLPRTRACGGGVERNLVILSAVTTTSSLLFPLLPVLYLLFISYTLPIYSLFLRSLISLLLSSRFEETQLARQQKREV